MHTFTIAHFSDLDQFTRKRQSRVRHTVTCIHVPTERLSFESVMPIGLQLPEKARQRGCRNLSSLQGEIELCEAAETTLRREAFEEYGLKPDNINETKYLISTLVPVSPDSAKAMKWDAQWLHWFGMRTERNFKPNPEHVAQFAWCSGAETFFDSLYETRVEKMMAFAAATASALRHAWIPASYRPIAELLSLNVDRAEQAA